VNAKEVLARAGIDAAIRAKNLNEQQVSQIVHAIQEGKYVIEGDLRREIGLNLKRLQAIKSYRGYRHLRGLPVRGQRTGTNARTRKGPRKTVGVQRNPNAKTGVH
jgi:small subunit ribosomal protein S13